MLQSYLLLPLALLLKKDECSGKKRDRGNKKGQVPDNLEKKRERKTRKQKGASDRQPWKRKKCETRGKNGQVSNSRIRGTRDPPE